ncbi:unnamed protein product [Caenorhabditis auriculariae]|uniref:Uncharacterized protein n=1 Tax=Caenorhabditis auriculariae TaxID=2777116 RepID=A0A8S1H3T7_9PELO|nr:unnamed protein product [Caenorhabditis auriculariae]
MNMTAHDGWVELDPESQSEEDGRIHQEFFANNDGQLPISFSYNMNQMVGGMSSLVDEPSEFNPEFTTLHDFPSQDIQEFSESIAEICWDEVNDQGHSPLNVELSDPDTQNSLFDQTADYHDINATEHFQHESMCPNENVIDQQFPDYTSGDHFLVHSSNINSSDNQFPQLLEDVGVASVNVQHRSFLEQGAVQFRNREDVQHYRIESHDPIERQHDQENEKQGEGDCSPSHNVYETEGVIQERVERINVAENADGIEEAQNDLQVDYRPTACVAWASLGRMMCKNKDAQKSCYDNMLDDSLLDNMDELEDFLEGDVEEEVVIREECNEVGESSEMTASGTLEQYSYFDSVENVPQNFQDVDNTYENAVPMTPAPVGFTRQRVSSFCKHMGLKDVSPEMEPQTPDELQSGADPDVKTALDGEMPESLENDEMELIEKSVTSADDLTPPPSLERQVPTKENETAPRPMTKMRRHLLNKRKTSFLFPQYRAVESPLAPRNVQCFPYDDYHYDFDPTYRPLKYNVKSLKAKNEPCEPKPCQNCRETASDNFHKVDMSDYKACEPSGRQVRAHLCDQSRVLIARIANWNREYSNRLGIRAHGTLYSRPDELTAMQMGFCSATVKRCIEINDHLALTKCSVKNGISREALDDLKSAFQDDMYYGDVELKHPNVLISSVKTSKTDKVDNQPSFVKLTTTMSDVVENKPKIHDERMIPSEEVLKSAKNQKEIHTVSDCESVVSIPSRRSSRRHVKKPIFDVEYITSESESDVVVVKQTVGRKTSLRKRESKNGPTKKRGRFAKPVLRMNPTILTTRSGPLVECSTGNGSSAEKTEKVAGEKCSKSAVELDGKTKENEELSDRRVL